LANRTLRILIDTGAAKNYVKSSKELRNVMPVDTPFTVSSIHGSSDVKNKCIMRIFGLDAPLSRFDAIIGFDSLTRAGVALDLGNSVIKYAKVTEKLKFFDWENVNFTKIDDIVGPSSAKAEFKKTILKRIKVFSTSNVARILWERQTLLTKKSMNC